MKKIILPIIVLTSALCAFTALAQSDVSAAQDPGLTLVTFYNRGGTLMHVLLAISVFCVANIIYLFAILRASLTVPRVAFNDIMEKVKTDKLEEAAKVCSYKPCPFSHVAAAAIRYALSAPVIDPIMLDAAMTGEGARQAAKLHGRTQWLLDIAAIAPMVGLLGTVIGMFRAFSSAKIIEVANRSDDLAAAVSYALVTTIAGLIVAIPAMGFYAWFRRQAARQVANLECACAELLSAMVSQFSRAN